MTLIGTSDLDVWSPSSHPPAGTRSAAPLRDISPEFTAHARGALRFPASSRGSRPNQEDNYA
jgi:hypothetical protein